MCFIIENLRSCIYSLATNMELYRDVYLSRFGRPFLDEAGLFNVKERSATAPFHSHKGIQIHIMLSGNLTRSLQDGSLQFLRGGMVSLVSPDIVHGHQHGIIHPGKHINLVLARRQDRISLPFSPKENKLIMHTLQKAGNCVARCNSELMSVAHNLDAAIQPPADFKDPYHAAWIRSLLAQLVLCTAQSIAQPVSSPKYYAVNQACNLIEQEKEEYHTAGQLARAVGMGPSRFRELFRKEMGQTVAEYRMLRRCARAEDKLIHTSDSITKIAFDLDFSSSQYFNQCFRKYMGQSPSLFRKRYQTLR